MPTSDLLSCASSHRVMYRLYMSQVGNLDDSGAQPSVNSSPFIMLIIFALLSSSTRTFLDRAGIVPSHLSSGVLGRMGRDSIEWCRPQNIVCHPSDELKTNQDGLLNHSDDMRRLNIILKLVRDDIERRTDEIDIERGVTRWCHRIVCKNLNLSRDQTWLLSHEQLPEQEFRLSERANRPAQLRNVLKSLLSVAHSRCIQALGRLLLRDKVKASTIGGMKDRVCGGKDAHD